MDDIRELERRRLRALVDKDLATARALHTPEYELVTPGADRMSKEEYLGAIESGDVDYHVFEPASEVDVVLLGADAAAVRYVARIEIDFRRRERRDSCAPHGYLGSTGWTVARRLVARDANPR